MLNFNLVGNSFTHKHSGHSGYSTYGKFPKYVDWKYDISLDTFYIEENMNLNLLNLNANNYGWLIEPKVIKPELYNHIKNNTETYLKKFKYIFTK